MKRVLARRWSIGLVMLLAALALSLVGCAGGALRATSWTGLAVVDDSVYAADLQQVAQLDAQTGDVAWTFPRNPQEDSRGVFYVTPAVSDDYVIAASATPAGGFFSQPKNVVWALDHDGRDVWSFSGASGQYVEGGAIGNGTFVIGSSDGNVYALDLDTGDLKWEFETGHRVWATPLIDGDIVYIGSMDRHLYALRIADGEEIWNFYAGGAFASEPV